MRNPTLEVALAIVLFLAWGGVAFAASVSTTFGVTAAVSARCLINSASAMDFGSSYDPGSTTAVDSASTIILHCTKTTPFTAPLQSHSTAGLPPHQECDVRAGTGARLPRTTSLDLP